MFPRAAFGYPCFKQNENPSKQFRSNRRFLILWTLFSFPAWLIQSCATFSLLPPHHVHFYELRPPVSSRYFIFCISSVLLSHTEPTLLPHVCLAFFLLSTVYSYSRQEFLTMHRHHNFYILNYITTCTAASIFIGDHMRPYGRRLCTLGLNHLRKNQEA